MGSQDCLRDPTVILQEAIDAGITIFQYREKGPGALVGQEKVTLGKKLRAQCKKHNIPFIINNDANLIETLDVDGIHVGQTDISPIEIRKKHPHLLIGMSISNAVELENSPLQYIDYIGVGAIFKTTSKSDAAQAVGTECIKDIHRLYPHIPLVGIGGITTKNASRVIEAGGCGVAVISAITHASNIEDTVKSL